MKSFALWTAVAVVLCLAACGDGRQARDKDKTHVYAGIPPVAYLADRIGGAHVRVDVLVSGNQDPHTFDPTPRQAVRLGQADIYLSVGLPFETSIVNKTRRNNPDMVVVHLAEAAAESAETGDHGSEAEHGHDEHGHEQHEADADHDGHAHGHEHGDGPDPHVWLSPPRLQAMARHVAHALAERDPAHQQAYRENLETFLADLEELDARIRNQLAPFGGRRFYVYHPAFGHFGEAYGLEQKAVETGGKAPSLNQIVDLVAQAREDKVNIIFVQPQFDPKAAESIARELDGAVVRIDPLRRNVLESLQQIADRLEQAFTRSAPREST